MYVGQWIVIWWRLLALKLNIFLLLTCSNMYQIVVNCCACMSIFFGRFVPIPPFVSLFLLISFFLPRGSWVIEKGEGRGVSNIPGVSEIPWLHQLSMQSCFVLWKTPLIVDYCTGPLPDGPSWRTPAYSSCAKPLENSPLKYRGKHQMKIKFYLRV